MQSKYPSPNIHCHDLIYPPPFPSPGCSYNFVRRGNICYGYVNVSMTWMQAQSTCGALGGGFLAEPRNRAENNHIKHLMNDHGGHNIWLGGMDLVDEGHWYWTRSGDYISSGFMDWYPGEPNNGRGEDNCMQVWRQQWDDDNCYEMNNFVCQLP